MTEIDTDIGQILEALNDKVDIDGNNFTEEGKQTIVGWGMPDYSAGVSVTLTSDQTYTAQYNQVLCATVGWGTANYGEILARTDNDTSSMSNIIFAGRGSKYDWGTYYLYLKKGQSIYIQQVEGVRSSTVYPLIGG